MLRIELEGNTFRITDTSTRNTRTYATLTDPTAAPHTSGRVGYAAIRSYQDGDGYNIRYLESSWQDKSPPPVPIPTGYLAWNTKAGSTIVPGTGGPWTGGPTWSKTTSGEALIAWPTAATDRNSALFAGPSGTYTITLASAVSNVDTLRFRASGYTISNSAAAGSITSASGRVFVDSAAASAIINTVLAGTNGLTKLGPGTLTLGGTGRNTYGGATTVSAGALVVSKDTALGTGAVTATASGTKLRLSGARLPNTVTIGINNLVSEGGANSAVGAVVLNGAASASDTISVNRQLFINGTVSGTAGGLIKAGSDTLVLVGNSSYAGATTVSAGGLQIGSGGATGALGSGSVAVASGAKIVFNRTGEFTHSGTISGAGGLVKRGSGDLTLEGTNAYQGGTTISGGRITITDAANIGSVAGAISIETGGTLAFNAPSASAAAVTFGRSMSGAGTFAKVGSGVLSLGSRALTIGKVSVEGGVLALGSDDTLSITGALQMSAGSTIRVALNRARRTSSRIRATGAADIALGTLDIPTIALADTGSYQIVSGTIPAGNTTGFGAVTVGGAPPTGSGYSATTSVSGGVVTLRIVPSGGGDAVMKNYLKVESAAYNAGTGSVTVNLSGLSELKEYLSGYTSVTRVDVLYRPGDVAKSSADATSGGGGAHQIPITTLQAATGNTLAVTFTVPTPADSLYYFNVRLGWTNGGASDSTISVAPADYGTAYLRDAKSVVKNGLTIVASTTSNTPSGLEFSVTVSGLNDPSFITAANLTAYRPSVDGAGVWYKRGGASLPSALELKKGGFDSLITTIVPSSAPGGVRQMSFLTGRVPQNRFADTIYFATAPHWAGAGVDSVAQPLEFVRLIVPNLDRDDMPNNPCVLDADQPNKRSPDITVALNAQEAFNAYASSVLVEFSFDPMFSPDKVIESFSLATTAVDGAPRAISSDEFVGEERLLYYRITVFGDAGPPGVEKTGSFTVGRAAPAPLTDFSAVALGSGWMQLSWNAITAPGSTDSIQIVYDTAQITSERISQLPAVWVSAAMTSFDVGGLAHPDRDYMFAAVVHDIVDPKKPAWNLKSAAAFCQGNTGSEELISNLVKVAKAVFSDANGGRFTVTLELTEDLNAEKRQYTYTYFVTHGAETVLAPVTHTFADIDVSNRLEDFTFDTDSLGDNLMFNTTYMVYAFTTDNNGKSSSRSSLEAKVGAFSMQTILIPAGGSGSVDNGGFRASAVGWSSVASAVVCTTTVSMSESGGNNTGGFIPLSDYGYQYVVKNSPSEISIMGGFSISMGLEKDAVIPPPYKLDDVRMYRWTGREGYWEVVYDTKYENGSIVGNAMDPIILENGSTYRLMINTQYPSARGLGNVTEVEVGDDITDNYIVSSNVGNFRVWMLYGSAERATGLDSVNQSSGSTTGTSRSDIKFTIARDIVNSSISSGVLAYVVVTDGHYTDTVNVSRQVISPRYSGFPVDAKAAADRKWLPFGTQVELTTADGRVVKNALGKFFQEDDDFAIYDTLFRLFRWYETPDNRSETSKWVEYDGYNENIFTMEPGRLMWFKTSRPQSLDFGASRTVPLTNSYNITLPPKQWTDLVLPFRFGICLGDILDSTSAVTPDVVNHLEFYRWKEPSGKQKSYITEALMLAKADSSVELKGADDPFTVYNSSDNNIVLRIPPRPAFMSSYYKAGKQKKSGLARAAAAQEASDVWYYALRTRTDNAPELCEVQIGYSARERAFAIPPSFGNESVVIVDETGREMGHHFSPALASGRTYRLRFYNDEKRKSTFTFAAHPSANTPGSAQITYVKASTGDILSNRSSEQSVTVAGMSHEDVLMIIGGSGYRAKAVAASPAGTKFRVTGIAVNRGTRSARINYYVPTAGVDRVEVSIYDIKGRLMWKNSQKAKAAVTNTMEWNSRMSRRGGASAVMYIVRVKAVGSNGRTVAVENKRITFVR